MAHDDAAIWPADIDPEHRTYLEARGVTPAVAAFRGYRSVRSGGGRNVDESYAAAYAGLPKRGGLLIPLHPLTGQQRYQLRPDEPRVTDAGRTVKFEAQSGKPNVLATSPLTVDAVRSGEGVLYIGEGVTRLDALAHYGIAGVAINGISGWKSKKLPIPDMESLPVLDRDVVIGVDGDITSNSRVWRQAQALGGFLKHTRGAANVGYLCLPDRLGLDDWIARERPADADDLLRRLQPHLKVDVTEPPSSGDASVDAGGARADWYEAGVCAGAHYRARYLRDRAGLTWWEWTNATHWTRTVKTESLTDEIIRDRFVLADAMAAAGRPTLAEMMKKGKRFGGRVGDDFEAGLRHALERAAPDPPLYEIATPNGVVDLRDGSVAEHDPLVHDTRGVTKGRYLPDDVDRLRGVLHDALIQLPNPEHRRQFEEIVGLALSGKAQSYSGLLWLVGQSGGGKGWIIRLLVAACGDRGGKVEAAFFTQRRDGGEIDTRTAEMIDRRPLIVGCDEVVSKATAGRLFTMTGGDEHQARRPHQIGMSRGFLIHLTVLTSTGMPPIPADAGLRRRLMSLRFDKELALTDDQRTDEFPQDLLDAVITVGIERAMRVGKPGWKRPVGDPGAVAAALSEADPLSALIDEMGANEWNGRPLTDLLKHVTDSLPGTDIRTLGTGVNAHPKWVTRRRTVRGVKAQYIEYCGAEFFPEFPESDCPDCPVCPDLIPPQAGEAGDTPDLPGGSGHCDRSECSFPSCQVGDPPLCIHDRKLPPLTRPSGGD